MFNKIFVAFVLMMVCAFSFAQDQITNLPTIYINTENNQGIYSKKNYVPCKVTIATDVDDDAFANKDAGIRGRGNSTWNMSKKPYRLKFDKKTRLFGRPAKAKSWVLLANYADKTLMRNALAFELSRFVGFDFNPTAVFVDVVLNGQYIGNYMVSDQMEVNPGRVEIDEMDAACISGDDLTGGYFLEIDGFGGSEPVHFNTNKGLIITVKSPDDDVIQPAQLAYIKNFIQKFENVLFSSDFADTEHGFRQYVDLKSIIDWYICCELTGNSDSFWSTYIYKKRCDDHLYFGPLWDFDIAFNNDNRLGDATYKLMRDNAHEPKAWIKRMWQAPWFKEAVCERWCELRSQGIEDYLLDFIDNTARYIDQSQKKNFAKWNVLNYRVYLEQFLFNTYQGGVDYLKEYIVKRIEFLDMCFRAAGAVSEITNITSGKEYHLLHYVDLYATAEKDNFYIKNPQANYQKLTFFATDIENVWNIRTSDGRFVASKTGDKYCTYTFDGADKRAQFVVESSQYDGYACIRNLYTNAYLGVEHTAHNSRISTNKNGLSTNHAWKILPVDFVGISDIEMPELRQWFDRATNTLRSDSPTDWQIYNIYGQCVMNAINTETVATYNLPSGLYIAHTPQATIKFLK